MGVQQRRPGAVQPTGAGAAAAAGQRTTPDRVAVLVSGVLVLLGDCPIGDWATAGGFKLEPYVTKAEQLLPSPSVVMCFDHVVV